MAVETRKRRFCAAFLILKNKSDVTLDCLRLLSDHNLELTTSDIYKQEKVCRVESYCEEIVPRYLPDEFQEHFRLTRNSFEQLVQRLGHCRTMQEAAHHGGAVPIPLEKQAMICCWYLGNLECFRSMADRFGVPKSSVHKSCKRVVECLCTDVIQEVIVWPSGESLQQTMDGFADLTDLERGITGAVDGSHIRIKAPREHGKSYINRKKFHSVVLQGVCNANLEFTHVYCGWPGCTHDARVLRNSTIFRNAPEKFPNNTYLIGDSAYPLQNWLMTPFRDNGNLTRRQKRFNYQLSKARQVIERSFGLLKNRWRRLRQFEAEDLKFLVDSILAACVLHNICLDDGLHGEEEVENEDPNNGLQQPLYDDQQRGVQRRQDMANQL